ncbi:acyl-CoA dehydrogenase family protein [Variovorax sp. J22G73]|uniref:acyl-CoA dehydrogenase family protein n=1 Tax=unclassified Variovorax TaxID=663243 RepID=UPI00257849BD|nr:MULTISPECIES: acyl-CoA dehydrogenase family protein [unclassified Variovorax]MDM0004752.1 acyl-CoA dehydrogenase family protein [Variovorax sp. J22R203]MDM0098168.1 acyl-CoA dehydrogenase family protein [Variovorax sp. J22G73]
MLTIAKPPAAATSASATAATAVPPRKQPSVNADEWVRPNREIIERATRLVPLIREHAAKTSEDRQVAPAVMQAIEQAGLFKLLVPKRYGGLGTNLRTLMETVAEVGRGDGSTSWAVALLNVCTWFATTYSQRAQDEVFGQNPNAKCCGIFTPGSKAERVEGGYRVSGRWAYASGSFAADWGTLGMFLPNQEGGFTPALGLIPASAWTIEDTWFVTGMKGSGSNTIVVVDHFVPDHRIQTFADLMEARFATPHQDTEPLANMVFVPVAALVLVGAQLGLGRAMMDLTLERLPNKPVAYTTYAQSKNSPTHQLAVASADTKIDLAYLLMQRACADIDGAAARGEVMSLLQRGRVRNDTGHIFALVKEAFDILMTANGAGAFAEPNIMNKLWRDSEIAGRHAYVTTEVGKEAYGRLLLGADGGIPLVAL